MSTLTEVIRAATGRHNSISDVLRQCLVLAYELENDALKTWLDHELNGYSKADELPDYRKINITAKGFFVGSFGSSLSEQPLAAHILEPQHRPWAEVSNLMLPIAAYEEFTHKTKKPSGSVIVHWPASLTTRYQTKFFEDWVLNRAWQEIPSSALYGLVDIIRNKTLKFALEIQKELGAKNDDLSSLPIERINQMVTNNIFGGNVVIAAHAENFSQTTIGAGDNAGLAMALEHLGVSEGDVSELIEAMSQDRLSAPNGKTLGQRTLSVLEKIAASGLKGGVEIAKPALTAMLMQYLGLPH
jgi:AbiTii